MVLFDNIRLIKEIEKRPPLYNIGLKESTVIKRVLWEEVYETLFPAWNNLTAEQKAITGRDVQQRWKNIRTCFTRELKAQRSLKLEQISHKRRKYMYFDNLLFLLPSTKPRSTYRETAPIKEKETLSSNELTTNTIFIQKYEAESERLEDPLLISPTASEEPKRPEESLLQTFTVHEESNQTRPEKSLPKPLTVRDKTAAECDADTHFVLSLVPLLQSLNVENKLIAQIEILQVFKKIEERQRRPLPSSESLSTVNLN
ncbi:uncharacterized protein LOC126194962 [Schistocerca nitens]|uniref:uncharacterized protein LOC126194962 n=1 Tax=Schistocerca nitens TaxID=7011 RepID=UPI00211916D1|nr:uncharacterized protein LOC126194962 [Schistocerca nitens]